MKNYSILPNVVTPEEISLISDYFYEKREIETVRVGYSFEPLHGLALYAKDDEQTKKDFAAIDSRILPLVRVLEKCKEYFLSNYTMENTFTYKRGFLNMMEAGAYLGEHSDDEDVYAGKKSKEIHYSGLLFLSDSYSGGELVFPEIDVSLKPNAGDLVLFKGSLVHGVNKVISGSRFNFVIFFKDYDPQSETIIDQSNLKDIIDANAKIHLTNDPDN